MAKKIVIMIAFIGIFILASIGTYAEHMENTMVVQQLNSLDCKKANDVEQIAITFVKNNNDILVRQVNKIDGSYLKKRIKKDKNKTNYINNIVQYISSVISSSGCVSEKNFNIIVANKVKDITQISESFVTADSANVLQVNLIIANRVKDLKQVIYANMNTQDSLIVKQLNIVIAKKASNVLQSIDGDYNCDGMVATYMDNIIITREWRKNNCAFSMIESKKNSIPWE